MRQTVVGSFKEYAAAQRAAEYLASQGIERDHIHVQTREGMDGSGAHGTEGVVSQVRSFFAEVFGPDSEGETPLQNQAETQQRAAAVVAVDVDEEALVTEVCRKLESAGAIELEQRSDTSRPSEWSGFDEGVSPAYAADRVPTSSSSRSAAVGASPVSQALSGSVLGDDTLSQDYREHWSRNYAALGGRYEDYDPAYRYGYSLAGDSRYQGLDWMTLEPRARQDWQSRHPDTAWERVKDSVRHAWMRASGRDMGSGSDPRAASDRDHFDRNYSHMGAVYDEYEPAYRYGSDIATESRYKGQDWDSIEASARNDWDQRHAARGGAWERIKDAVKHAWDRARH